ncbi:cyclic nucleotide-binding domain-containing protein [Salipiger sp. PrR003]|uniref:cyclic nucleotide-binding domain-containing protein n=1 Tax=Salipiger sp. PrR003 TaxID=2706776 RepID=UPI0013DD7CCA|nr:cyclic nucleotide-binding domain-containing protein [Salipiger sp. PrR003]NDV50761.1 cyclic nucleotide-binding domain-containing protein [Salipiger sp. PrR003]
MNFEEFSPEAALRGCSTFENLSREALQDIATGIELIELNDDEYLFLQGNSDEFLYQVMSGEIELVRSEVFASQDHVGIYGAGDLVGVDVHLLSDPTPVHFISAKAKGSARVMRVPARLLDHLGREHPEEYDRLRRRALVQSLEHAPTNNFVEALIEVSSDLKSATCPTFTDGQMLFEQGDTADYVYLLLSGSVRIEKSAADGSQQMVARLRPGQLFGEAGLSSGATRRASAVAEGASYLLKLSVNQFRLLMDGNPSLRKALEEQNRLYSSQHSKYHMPAFIQHMKMSTRLSLLTLMTVLSVLWATFGISMSYIEDAMISTQQGVVQRQAADIRSNIVSLIERTDAASYSLKTYALKQHEEDPENLTSSSFRNLEVYYVHGESPELPQVPKAAEKVVRELLEAAFTGQEIADGFVKRRLGNDAIAYFRVEPVQAPDQKTLGYILSGLYPEEYNEEHAVVLSPGEDKELPDFAGQVSDLRSAVDGVADANDTRYSVSKSSVAESGLRLEIFSWEPLTEQERILADLSFWGVVAIMVCSVIAAFITLALSSWTLQPIHHLSHALRRLSEGQRGIVVPFASRRNEVGNLAGAIHQLQTTIQYQERIVAEQMKEQQVKVHRQEENRRAIAAFRVRFEDLIGELITSVSTVSSVSEKLLSGSKNAAEGTSNILQTAQETKRSVEQVENLARELRAAAQQIDTHTEASDRSLAEASRNMEDAKSTIQQLGHVVDEVGTIAETISRIADQTRILAWNARIEASRAGRAGKGFGVVATEVSKLANQTSDATGDIRQKVENIESASQGVVAALTSIDTVMKRMLDEHVEIRGAVGTQTEATRHIAEDVVQTSRQTREVSESLGVISQLVAASQHGSEELARSSELLTGKTEDFYKRIEGFLKSVSD